MGLSAVTTPDLRAAEVSNQLHCVLNDVSETNMKDINIFACVVED